MTETRKLAAILVADVVGYSLARRCRRGSHARAPEENRTATSIPGNPHEKLNALFVCEYLDGVAHR
jgi:hypothetical protein